MPVRPRASDADRGGLTRARSARSWVGALAVLFVAVAACGGGGTKSSTATSPADAALGLDKKGLQRRQLKVEALLATCMRAQGFEYVPVDPTNIRPGQGGQVSLPNLSEDDFRKQYGYGLTTLYGTLPNGAPAPTNPNKAIRDALSASDRAAYDRALSGGKSDGTFASAIDQGDFSMLDGCNKEATQQVFGGPQVLSALQTALDDLDKRVAQDARVAAAHRKWSACMNRVGFRFAIGDEIDKYLTDKLQAITGTTSPPTATNGSTPPQYDRAALATLQQEELKLADADFTCDRKLVKPVTDKVQAEVERAFLSQNPNLVGKVKG